MAAVKYWLWLASQTGVSPRARAALIAHYGGAEEAFFAPSGDFARLSGLTEREAALLEERDLSQVDAILAACRCRNLDVITMQDADYPDRLKGIFAPPVALFVQGSLKGLEETAAVSVIGTRGATPYGLKMGRRLASQIAGCGGAVVSTLSPGIDEAAIRAALLSGGFCVGVLGCAHPENPQSLYRDIAASGALVSEYPPGTATQKSFFRDRNRIASGLSLAVAVVEAPSNSGALLFAAEALEQGKEIFAVPGNADAQNSAGTNALLKQGARPVTCGWDVLADYAPLYPNRLHQSRGTLPEERVWAAAAPAPENPVSAPSEKPASAKKEVDKEKSTGYIDLRDQLSGLSTEQLEIITAIGKGRQHIDDIIDATGLPAAKVLAQLTFLEIKGYISRGAGKRISLNIKR